MNIWAHSYGTGSARGHGRPARRRPATRGRDWHSHWPICRPRLACNICTGTDASSADISRPRGGLRRRFAGRWPDPGVHVGGPRTTHICAAQRYCPTFSSMLEWEHATAVTQRVPRRAGRRPAAPAHQRRRVPVGALLPAELSRQLGVSRNSVREGSTILSTPALLTCIFTLDRGPGSRLTAEPRYLKFRRYAAAASLVVAPGWNRSGVSWAAVMLVIRARRNAMIMSSMETWRLWRYQGA